MEQSTTMTQWLGPALVGAAIAAVGYVAKLILEWLGGVLERQRARRARLVQLHSLLRAGKVAYDIQCENRNRLRQSIIERNPKFGSLKLGYEELFKAAYTNMTDDEKELHTIIRSITTNTIQPLNEALIKWLQDDTHFKATPWGLGYRVRLAKKLADLEAHLLLWRAKYTVWIPDHPSHSLVYLADEKRHGVGFPDNIEDDVQVALRKRY